MYSGNSYKNFPALYDLLYQRYFKSIPDFVMLVKKNTPKIGKILDLAAGTGEVSIPLLKQGFKVMSLDASAGMLKELKAKAVKAGIKNTQINNLNMGDLKYKNEFDTICIRQAINYFLGAKKLEFGLKKIFTALKPGGKFIFNAPNYHGEKSYQEISNFYEVNGQKAFVLETNKLKGRLLKHQQYSVVWNDVKEPQFVIDENSFYMFAKNEFEKSLKRSGFSKIEFSGTDKTLYCIATK